MELNYSSVLAPAKNHQISDPRGFPSSFVPPSEKGKEWCLNFAKAFHREFTLGGGKIMRYAFQDYEKHRQYAKGQQPIDQYKEMMSVKKNRGKNNMSWRNLDWNILPILPTLVSVVVNKVLGQQKDIVIRGIDQVSQNQERTRRNQIVTYLTNLPLLQKANQSLGVPIESPLEEGAPIPANMQEVDLHMQMYPKDRYVMELYDQIERVMNINNWKQIWNDVVNDLIEVGVAGTKSYIDISGMVRVRRVIPERVITNNCVNPDFSDATRVGEYIQMSISELRSSVPRGTFTEEDYAVMATKATGTTYNTLNNEAYFRTNFRYPYDHEKVQVLDFECLSADEYAYVVEKSNVGNLNLSKQKDPYWLNRVEWKDETGKVHVGVTDEQYVEFHKQRGSDRHVVRDSLMNLYGGKWIVGTNFIFDWGRKTNMQRSVSRLGDCRLNYNFYTFFDSYIRRAEPVADQIQINWLQHQHHIAKSKPSGVKINKRALASLTVGGKAGIELDELDVLQMYAETGNLVYKAEDAAGRPYPYDPIQELEGGVNEAADKHFLYIIQNIDLLRTIFGLNQATDSSTPNPKLGKAIAEMLEQNTNTALGTVYHAYSHLFEETIKSIALLVPDAEMIKTTAKDEALGESSGQFFRTNNDVTFREVGISIEDGPTSQVRERLQKYIELSIAAKEIRPEDAYLIEDEPNIMRAYYLLALKRRQKIAEDAQMQQATYQMELQKNIESANAAEQAKVQAAQMINQADIEKAYALHPLDIEKITLPLVAKEMMARIDAGNELTMQDRELIFKYREALLKADTQIQIAKMKPKPKPAAKKSA